MNISFELLPIRMPSVISLKMPVSKRQNGLVQTDINVADLTDEQAAEYAELLKQTFLSHHVKLREAKNKANAREESDDWKHTDVNAGQ